MRVRPVVFCLWLCACGDPRGGDAGPSLPDAGAGACPADVARAEGASCERPGLTCASPACARDRCAPGCVRLVCAEAPDGDRFAREAPCEDAGAGPDAGARDAAVADAGPPGPCRPLAADAARLVRDTDTSATATSIVWDGAGYAVVWSQLATLEPVIYAAWFARVDREGAVVPGSVRRLFDDAGQQFPSALALGEGELGLAYVRGAESGLTVTNRAWFARLALDGTPLDGAGVPLSELHPPHHGQALAWSPTRAEWLVAWEGTEPLGGGFSSSHVYATRLDAAGAILDAAPVRLDELTSTSFSGDGSLVWTGDRFAIGLAEYASASDARVVLTELDPATAAPLRRTVLARPNRPAQVAVATDGASYVAAWTDLEPSSTVWLRRAAVGGDPLGDAVRLAEPAFAAYSPSVTASGGTFRVVFHRGDATVADLWFGRYAADGTELEPPSAIAPASPPYGSFPRVATDGCNDAILWTAVDPGDARPDDDSEIRLHLVAP